ncbi:hypothetical protein B0T18DRAFT_395859 [Schizothecium vesticola]|uniref:Uncharacterized protein n=1 Tax=Schizothecium vesticola TaxID=314040 RepID=A0AA40F8A2_9PEZI|nr:hypothetical protein B0T18DRAFT_395859 [Schizothecium vesticola]
MALLRHSRQQMEKGLKLTSKYLDIQLKSKSQLGKISTAPQTPTLQHEHSTWMCTHKIPSDGALKTSTWKHPRPFCYIP